MRDVPTCTWCNIRLVAIDDGVEQCPACRELFFSEGAR